MVMVMEERRRSRTWVVVRLRTALPTVVRRDLRRRLKGGRSEDDDCRLFDAGLLVQLFCLFCLFAGTRVPIFSSPGHQGV